MFIFNFSTNIQQKFSPNNAQTMKQQFTNIINKVNSTKDYQ